MSAMQALGPSPNGVFAQAVYEAVVGGLFGLSQARWQRCGAWGGAPVGLGGVCVLRAFRSIQRQIGLTAADELKVDLCQNLGVQKRAVQCAGRVIDIKPTTQRVE